MTPKDYWDLTVDEYLVMRQFMREWRKEEKRQAERLRAKSRRR